MKYSYRLSLLFLICCSCAIAGNKYRYCEEHAYSGADSVDTGYNLRQIFDEKGNKIFEENVGHSKTWFTYQDTLLVEELEVSWADSVDVATNKTFENFYTDTMKTYFSYKIDSNGKIVSRQELTKKFTAKNARDCVEYVNEVYDYTRAWITFRNNTVFKYDFNGRKIAEYSANDTNEWSYDNLGRIVEEYKAGIHRHIFVFEDNQVTHQTIYLYRTPDTLTETTTIDSVFDAQKRLERETTTTKNPWREGMLKTLLTIDYGKDIMKENHVFIWIEGEYESSRKGYTVQYTNKKPSWANSILMPL